MADGTLFWHRRDLRVSDSVGLAAAAARSPQVVGVFCLDPAILERDDIAPARITYLIGCLRSLQADYERLGSELLIVRGNPVDCLPPLAQQLGATLAWHWDVEPYSKQRDRAVLEACHRQNIPTVQHWDRLLHEPNEVLTGGGDPYRVYTPFWRNWSGRPKPEPEPTPGRLVGPGDRLGPGDRQALGIIALPTAAELGWEWDQPLILEPGTAAASDRLDEFAQAAIFAYDAQRNLPSQPGTSGLSAALTFGAIGIRQVWQASAAALAQCRSDEARTQVRTWQQELAWREFYQCALYHFPELADGPYRALWRTFPWENDPAKFAAWCAGRTGFPIVDAAMRQLNETGWMHNRCRMIVASFLTKDLRIDWRWGEKYFMQTLIDGDLAANNGGWQWSASSGMDPKPLRIFNPASQAQKFDPDAEYIRQWLPEIRSADTGSLVTGKLTPFERSGTDYPAPIVDRQTRQRDFKAIYNAHKANFTDSE